MNPESQTCTREKAQAPQESSASVASSVWETEDLELPSDLFNRGIHTIHTDVMPFWMAGTSSPRSSRPVQGSIP